MLGLCSRLHHLDLDPDAVVFAQLIQSGYSAGADGRAEPGAGHTTNISERKFPTGTGECWIPVPLPPPSPPRPKLSIDSQACKTPHEHAPCVQIAGRLRTAGRP